MKFVMSLLVVVIHCFIIEDFTNVSNEYVGNGVSTIIRQAVPFFFAASAFLLFRKLKLENVDGVMNEKGVYGRMTLYLKHILRMYIIWYALFTLLQLFQNDSVGISVTLRERGYNFLFWGGGHLWYLWAMLIVMPVIVFFTTKFECILNSKRTIFFVIAGVIGMVLFRFYSHYGSVSNPLWWQKPLVYGWQGHVFNVFGVCDALMYLSVGVFFALTECWKQWNKRILICVIVLSFVYSHFDNGESSLGCIPICFAIMALTLSWKVQGNASIYKFLRNMSTFIYLVHPICIGWGSCSTDNPFLMTGYSVLFSIIVSFTFVIVSNRVRVLKYLV